MDYQVRIGLGELTREEALALAQKVADLVREPLDLLCDGGEVWVKSLRPAKP